jgi:hypothetical protein
MDVSCLRSHDDGLSCWMEQANPGVAGAVLLVHEIGDLIVIKQFDQFQLIRNRYSAPPGRPRSERAEIMPESVLSSVFMVGRVT